MSSRPGPRRVRRADRGRRAHPERIEDPPDRRCDAVDPGSALRRTAGPHRRGQLDWRGLGGHGRRRPGIGGRGRLCRHAAGAGRRRRRRGALACGAASKPAATAPDARGKRSAGVGCMRVLVLTHRLPFAPNRGDRIRAFHIIKQLAARADVHVVSLVHDREEEAQADTLRQLGVAVSTAFVPRTRNLALAALKLPTSTPPTHLLLDSPAMQPALVRALDGWRPDVVLAYCSGVAPLSLVAPLAGIPFMLD